MKNRKDIKNEIEECKKLNITNIIIIAVIFVIGYIILAIISLLCGDGTIFEPLGDIIRDSIDASKKKKKGKETDEK